MFKELSIKSIKPIGRKTVYDITVDGDHSYVANGIVNHNSSREPNLQNIPRDTTSSDIKEMFICPPGYCMLQVDYSQAELRVLAAVAKEAEMLDWFNTGKDIHLASACKKYGEDYDEIIKIYSDESHKRYKEWKIKRKQAKTINFGIVYGQGANKLSESLSSEDHKVGLDEAREFLKDFNRTFKNVAGFVKRQHNKVKKDAYVKNLFGRKRRLYDIDSDNSFKRAEAERASVNAPIQGAASDFALFSSILIREEIKFGKLPRDMYQVGTVHDSIIYYIRPKDVKDAIPIITAICANPQTKKWFDFQIDSVKMKVDAELGLKWSKLANYKPEIDYTELLS